MILGNIIFEKDLVNHKRVDYVKYYTGDNILINNPGLPTLYVGWEFIKQFQYKDLKNINILKKEIIKNELYWEFSFDEEKENHIKGVEKFVENVPDYYFMSRYNYMNLDPVFHRLSNVQDIMNVIPSQINCFYLLRDRMLYILADNKIYGLDLDMYRFFKFNIEGLLTRLNNINVGNTTFDEAGEIYQKYYKLFPDFPALKRYLVVLMTI